MMRRYEALIVVMIGAICTVLIVPTATAGAACCKKLDVEQAGSGSAFTTSELDIPDVDVVDHRGAARRFRRDLIDDRIVVVNFIFTTCTTICPPMGANFGRLQDALGERLGRDVSLVSVSLDPLVDTPDRLTAWSDQFDRRDGWTLVSGGKAEVDRILRALGALVPDKTDHAPLLLVGNASTNEWTRVNGFASPKKVLEVIERLSTVDVAAAEVSQ